MHCHQYQLAATQLAIVAARRARQARLRHRPRRLRPPRRPRGPGRGLRHRVPADLALLGVAAAARGADARHPRRRQPALHGARRRAPCSGRVLYVGRVMRHKGIDVLIDALPPRMGLDVVGRVYDPEYAALLRERAEGRDVRFVHDASDEVVAEHYRRALVTVLPSRLRRRLRRLPATAPSCSAGSCRRAWRAARRSSAPRSAACPRSSATARTASRCRRTTGRRSPTGSGGSPPTPRCGGGWARPGAPACAPGMRGARDPGPLPRMSLARLHHRHAGPPRPRAGAGALAARAPPGRPHHRAGGRRPAGARPSRSRCWASRRLDCPPLEEMIAAYEPFALDVRAQAVAAARTCSSRARPSSTSTPTSASTAPLDDAFAAAERHGLVLTRHLLGPLPRDGRHPSEEDILLAGRLQRGLRRREPRGPRGSCDWWAERLARGAARPICARGLFLDQRWLELAPGLVPGAAVLRDPGVQRRVLGPAEPAADRRARCLRRGRRPAALLSLQRLRPRPARRPQLPPEPGRPRGPPGARGPRARTTRAELHAGGARGRWRRGGSPSTRRWRAGSIARAVPRARCAGR